LRNDFAESSVADEAAAEGEHGFVHIVASFVADEQSFELVEVGEGAFDDPADASQAGPVLGAAAGECGGDAALAEQTAVLVEVVAAVADHPIGPSPWPADESCDRRDTVEQRDQLGDVVAVSARQRESERDAFGVDEEVVLRPASAPVDRARARFGAPFFAWM
jgi:hypothetical protein